MRYGLKNRLIKRMVFVAGFCLIAGKIGAAENNTDFFAERYNLRCYGPVTAEEMPPLKKYGDYQHLRITSRDKNKAELLISKLLSDFTTLPTVSESTVKSGNQELVGLSLDSGRQILPVLKKDDNFIDVYFFENKKQMDDFLENAPQEFEDSEFVNERRHPFYMDFWDQHCMGFWYRLQTNHEGWSDEQDFEFLKKHGLTLNGVGPIDSVAAKARSNGLGYKINRWFDVGNWVYEKYPQAAFKSDPDITVQSDYYGDVPFAENPIEKIQVASIVNFLKQYIDDEYLISITDPHGETGPFATSFSGGRGRGEYSRRDFIHYLRDIRKISLFDLGQRWFGKENYFNSWEDVTFPRERLFYGWKDGESQDLSGTWKLRMIDRQEGEETKVFTTEFDDSHWLTYQQPGSQYLAQKHPHKQAKQVGGWVRFQFTPEQRFIDTKEPVYLTICPFNFAPYKNPSTIYLNGQKLKDLTIGYGEEWGQIEINKVLKKGVNTISAFLPKGYIGGPVFLSTNKMEDFPTTDLGLNARRYDVREWVADSCARANKRYLEYMRGIDPNRPIKLMAFHTMADIMMPYVALLGAYPHCTGEGAFFRPWDKRNGFLRGIQDSSEPGGPADTLAALKRFFFIMTFEGMNAHDYFWDLDNILAKPDLKEHYEKNVPYYKLMGRFNLKKPDIAVTRSLKSDRYYGDSTAYDNDLTRGDIQQSHFGYVVCYEPDIAEGLLDNYKIIVDNNFHTLNPEEVKDLKAWVEKGGILILNQRSGRNTYMEKNSWPIRTLTGCKAEIRPEQGQLTFEKEILILQSYAGKTFKNEGKVINWQNYDYYEDCIALTPESEEVEVLAKYDDGKAAIVMRELGKGKVIVLGSAFYRDSSDQNGFFVGSEAQTKFYSALFSSLGVKPLVESDNINLWAERFISNNGTTEMLVLGNQNNQESINNASIIWELDFTPKRVFDPDTGKDIKVTIDGNKIVLDKLNFDPLQMRYYAVERLNLQTEENIVHWLNRQQEIWRAVPSGREAPEVDPSMPLQLTGNFMVKQFDNENDARAALETADFNSTWKTLPKGMWSAQGLKQGKDLWAVYRKGFNVSDAWLKNLRGAEPLWSSWPLMGVPNEIYLNDLLVIKNDKVVAESDKILAAIHAGENEFKLICRGRNVDGEGGFMGEFMLRRVPGGNGEEIDISKNWIVYLQDNDSIVKSFPCKVNCVIARKTLMIPEKYSDKTVWLEVKAKEPNQITFVSTNGRVRYHGRHASANWLGAMWINITPDIKFGAENDIIIGNRNVLTMKDFSGGETDFEYAKLIFSNK
jgi:hypothetical protein